MDNPETRATSDTRHNQEWTFQKHEQHRTQDTIKNGHSRNTSNIGHKTQSRMDNPETRATSDTRHNQEWTIQKHEQHRTQDTERNKS